MGVHVVDDPRAFGVGVRAGAWGSRSRGSECMLGFIAPLTSLKENQARINCKVLCQARRLIGWKTESRFCTLPYENWRCQFHTHCPSSSAFCMRAMHALAHVCRRGEVV